MPTPEFSQREIKIAQMLFKEFSSEEIADRLTLSVRTIESIRMQMLRKMRAKNVIGIVKYALKEGWVKA